MIEKLNAYAYPYANTDFGKEFEKILIKIIDCYNLMMIDNISLTNDENYIRNILLVNYLNNNQTRQKINLTDYLFDREVPESGSFGRSDIKIQTQNTFKDTSAYYIIECKRLDNKNLNGKTGLNAEYIKNGISRFVTGYYSSYYGINGMIGFVVDDLKIETNFENLNYFLNQDLINDKGISVNANATQQISSKVIKENFKYSYISKHLTCNQKEIVLYHLMFDFSKNIR